MTREVVKFNGQPVTVALGSPTGKPGTNDRGKFFTYGVEGNKVFFATPALDSAIQNQTPGKGTRLNISRCGEDEWQVVKLDPPAEPPKACVPTAAQPTAVVFAAPNPSTGPLRFYTEAVDLVIAVEKYAAEHGRELRFAAEDVRAIAATARISAEGR